MSKVYIVLGTGRSATSWVAESLGKNGAVMWEGDNSHFEDDAFKKINREIIKDAGGDSFNIPSQDKIDGVFPFVNLRIKKLIEDRCKKHDKWGFKDPLTVFTLDFYLEYLKEHDVYLIYSLRNFSRVRDSLLRLGWTDKKRAEETIKRYKQRLIEIIEKVDDL